MVIWVLNVAEKPSVARSVASILSGTANPRSREGRSRFNRVFEFDYAIRGQQCRMLMTSVTGHLMELEFDCRYRKWNSCDPAALYEAPVRKHVPEVTKVSHQEKRKYPPYPLDTVELQRRASQYFRMSSEHTVKLSSSVEMLYVSVMGSKDGLALDTIDTVGSYVKIPRVRMPCTGEVSTCTERRHKAEEGKRVEDESSRTRERERGSKRAERNRCSFSRVMPKHAQDKLDIKKTLEEEARKCQWLALWLDCDREGENIAFEVIEVCTSANQRLNIFRAHFSALIDREIHEAVQNLGRPNPLFADAADARQVPETILLFTEIDLRIGASFTRLQTMFLRDAFNLDISGDDKNVVLSYGPCQFPTLGFVVERFWEIQSHEPEEFWTINCSHVSEDGSASFTWMRGHLFDYSSTLIIYEMCFEESTATVTKVSHQEKRKYPPYPLNTVELQRRASQYFRMSSEHTMKVAEDLYQAGFISYPRTETDVFSANTNLHMHSDETVFRCRLQTTEACNIS